MKKSQRFETEYTKDKKALDAPVYELAMAKIVDIMKKIEDAEPKPVVDKKKKEEPKEPKTVDEAAITKDDCSKYKGGEFSKYEKMLKGKIAGKA
tara:strand:- start:130 stop:411 length:282 start_codon:yes stop_codon:yes gene_type:complete